MVTLKRIFGCWVPTLLSVLLVGCSKEKESPLEERLTVHLMLNMPATRADAVTAADVEGNDYYLSPRDVQLLVYDTDGNFRDRAIMTSLTPVAGSYTRYTVTGTMTGLSKTEVESGTQYRLVVLSNLAGDCPVYFPYGQIPSTESDLYSKTIFETSVSTTLTQNLLDSAASGRIPMWGKKTTALQDGSTIEVDMLRALAKVKVYLDSDVLNRDGIYDLTSVVVDNCNMSGNLAPLNAATSDTYEPSSTEVNIPSELKRSAVPFYEYPAGSNVFYIYLPEQAKGAAEMEVIINNSVYNLQFGDYATMTKFPVVRNWYYTFRITEIKTDNTLVYQVCKWNEVTVDPITFD